MHEEARALLFCAKVIRTYFPSMQLRTKRRVQFDFCEAQEGYTFQVTQKPKGAAVSREGH